MTQGKASNTSAGSREANPALLKTIQTNTSVILRSKNLTVQLIQRKATQAKTPNHVIEKPLYPPQHTLQSRESLNRKIEPSDDRMIRDSNYICTDDDSKSNNCSS